MDKKILIPMLKGANAIYPKNVLENIGLFDETFYAAEDRELSLKIVLRGLRLVYVSDAIVYHKHPNSLSGLCKQFFEYGRYDRILREKYKNIIDLNCGPRFMNVFRLKVKNFKNLSKQEKPLEILFSVIDIIKYLAYSVGWLSLILFRHPSIKSSEVPSPISNKVFRRLDEELIISDISKEYNYALRDVGTRIHELLTSGAIEIEIIDRLSKEYQVSKDEVKKDLTEFVSELKKEKLFNRE